MKITDYHELINNNEYELIYNKISNIIELLIKDILNILDIHLEEYNYKEIQYQIQKRTIIFNKINIICNILDTYKDEEFLEHINTIINNYNSLIKTKEEYLIKSKEITNYNESLNDLLDNYRILFKKMLRYKNKEYNSNWNYKELINKIDLYYAYYHKELKILSSLLNSNLIIIDNDLEEITVNNIEKILILEDIYNKINNNYKEYANYYEDINIEENQSIEDLLDIEDAKYEELYIEMLEYKNIPYQDEELETLIYKYYPEYKKDLTYVHSANLHSKSIVEIINTMEKTYNNIKENYQK